MATIGEDGIHQIEAESRSDALQGDAIRIEYVPVTGGDPVTGASVVGVSEGSVMAFSTDFSQAGIQPGVYEIEFIRSDGTQERQIDLVGENDNKITVEVTDADSI
jgi:predicted Zn-dependent protease